MGSHGRWAPCSGKECHAVSVPGLTAARQPAAIPEAAATFLPEERAQGAAAAVGYPKAAPAACCQVGRAELGSNPPRAKGTAGWQGWCYPRGSGKKTLSYCWGKLGVTQEWDGN